MAGTLHIQSSGETDRGLDPRPLVCLLSDPDHTVEHRCARSVHLTPIGVHVGARFAQPRPSARSLLKSAAPMSTHRGSERLVHAPSTSAIEWLHTAVMAVGLVACASVEETSTIESDVSVATYTSSGCSTSVVLGLIEADRRGDRLHGAGQPRRVRAEREPPDHEQRGAAVSERGREDRSRDRRDESRACR